MNSICIIVWHAKEIKKLKHSSRTMLVARVEQVFHRQYTSHQYSANLLDKIDLFYYCAPRIQGVVDLLIISELSGQDTHILRTRFASCCFAVPVLRRRRQGRRRDWLPCRQGYIPPMPCALRFQCCRLRSCSGCQAGRHRRR